MIGGRILEHGLISKLAYQRFLESRRLHTLVESNRFKRACEDADESLITKLVTEGSFYDLKTYMSNVRNNCIEHMPVDKLRKLAKQYGIKEYYCLTRTQLIERIQDEKKRYSESA